MEFIFAIFGLCLGSFFNVLILRLPLNLSINFPASHCFSCKNKLKFYHNIPLFSWIFLGGKCGFCKSKISFQYPFVEILCAILMLVGYFYEISLINAVLIGTIFGLLLSLSIVDLRYKAVPDGILYPATILSLVYGSFKFGDFSFDGLIYGTIFALIFLSLRASISFVIKKEAMGIADVYIAFCIGSILSWKLGFVAIYLAAIFALIAYFIIRKRDFAMPFVPFLSLGILVSYLFKDQILEILRLIYG